MAPKKKPRVASKQAAAGPPDDTADAPSAPAPEAEGPAKPPTRRRGRAKPEAATTSDEEAPKAAEDAAPNVDEPNAEAKPPTRRRRKATKATKAEEEPPETAAGDATKEGSASEQAAEDAAPAKKKAKKAATKTAPEAIARSPTPRATSAATLGGGGGGPLFKILSVNVAGLRATLDPTKGKVDAFAAAVRAEDPDVLLLNEHKLNPGDVEAAEEKLAELFPSLSHRVFACSTAKKGYSGVAALCKAPFSSSENTDENGVSLDFPGNPFPQEGRVVSFDVLSGRCRVVAVYVPNSGQSLERLPARVQGDDAWDRALGRYVDSFATTPCLVVGDLNVAHKAIDIHNMYARPTFEELLTDDEMDAEVLDRQYVGIKAAKSQAGLTPQERLSFSRLLADAGLRDAFREFHPNARGVFTYYSQRVVQNRPLNRGLRLDYVLASDSLFAAGARRADASQQQLRLLDAFVLDKDPPIADHVPVGCVLGLVSAGESPSD